MATIVFGIITGVLLVLLVLSVVGAARYARSTRGLVLTLDQRLKKLARQRRS